MAKNDLNLLLRLDDNRQVMVLRGKRMKMIARQIGKGPPLYRGETVFTLPGRDGRKIVLRVVQRTAKWIEFMIVGSCDGNDVDRKRADMGIKTDDTENTDA